MKQGLIEALREVVERLSGDLREAIVVDACLAGGIATFVHLHRSGGLPAGEARYSEDADIHFSRTLVLSDDVVVGYRDHRGEARLLALDRNYRIDIGLRHPGCFDAAELLFESDNGRLRLHVLTATDLAVTKAGRFHDHDREDIRLLAAAGLLNPAEFHKRAVEALAHVATDPTVVRINLDVATALIQDASPEQAE